MSELEQGWLVGPFEPGEVLDSYTLSRRFGVVQGPKTRCVDDFTRSSVNLAVQVTESPRPHTVDVLGALLFAHIAVRNAETGRACIFRMLAPAWEREILRVAHSIWFILAQHLSVLTTNYFDDFVVVARRSESKHLTAVIHGLLKLLGWSFAESGSKAPDFDSSTNALGVTINVAKLHLGEVEIDNTPSRKEDLAKIVNDIQVEGSYAVHSRTALRSSCSFALESRDPSCISFHSIHA